MWDLLYQRYSDPMMLLDQMIQAGRLCEFIKEFIDIRNDEVKEKVQWELYLHKVFDKTYEEFLKDVKEPAQLEEADMKQVETTVKSSINILENFNLD